MKIQYCSDLHLEFEKNSKYLYDYPLKVSGEILILAGDIVPLHDKYLTHPFLRNISEQYKKVFWLAGNHEFYHRDMAEFSKTIDITLYNNIHIVNDTCVEYNGIRFIFSALWSNISPQNEIIIEQGVSDFECISINNKKFRASDFNRLHADSLSFIKKSINKTATKTVVITHHLPSKLCNSKANENSLINEAFCVDLTDFIETCNADFWIYGHSHFNQKPLYIGKTLVITNQLGYVHYNEQNSFKNNAYFSI